MNTYRISISTVHRPDRGVQLYQFDVDALRPLTAIMHALESKSVTQFDTDLVTVTSQLYAKDIFPLNGKTIRKVAE